MSQSKHGISDRGCMAMSDVSIQLNDAMLGGKLEVPEHAIGLVVFAHGSGSSRYSLRNNTVAQSLNEAGLATLLFDLLTSKEDEIDQMTRQYRLDIPLLVTPLVALTQWIKQQPTLKNLTMGYSGSSTGAAAAFIAAAKAQVKQSLNRHRLRDM